MAKRGQGEGTISKRPDGTWWARITVGRDAQGKQKRKAFYGKTRKEVQEKLTAALNEINAGTYIEPSKMKIGQWMDVWLKEYTMNSVQPSTYARNEHIIRKYIKPIIGECILKDLRHDMVQRYINNLNSEGVSSGQIQRAYNLLKNACEQAVINEMIPKNPVLRTKYPKHKVSEARVLTREEQEKLVKVAPLYPDGNIFIFMLFTGLRVGEALALTWDDIDFDNKTAEVNKSQTRYKRIDGKVVYALGVSKPKTETSNRKVPLIPKLVDMLEKLKTENENKKLLFGDDYNSENIVFCNAEGKMSHSSNIRRRLQTITKQLGIEGVHPHTMRHTFATRGAEQGIDIKVMQTLLGHSEINTTANIYTHVLEEQKALNISKLEPLL